MRAVKMRLEIVGGKKIRVGRWIVDPPVEGASGLAQLQQATDEIRWTVLKYLKGRMAPKFFALPGQPAWLWDFAWRLGKTLAAQLSGA
jgi:hypothetical protein